MREKFVPFPKAYVPKEWNFKARIRPVERKTRALKDKSSTSSLEELIPDPPLSMQWNSNLNSKTMLNSTSNINSDSNSSLPTNTSTSSSSISPRPLVSFRENPLGRPVSLLQKSIRERREDNLGMNVIQQREIMERNTNNNRDKEGGININSELNIELNNNLPTTTSSTSSTSSSSTSSTPQTVNNSLDQEGVINTIENPLLSQKKKNNKKPKKCNKKKSSKKRYKCKRQKNKRKKFHAHKIIKFYHQNVLSIN